MKGAVYINGHPVTNPRILKMTLHDFINGYPVEAIRLVPNGNWAWLSVQARMRVLAVRRRKRQARARTGRRS